MRSRTRCLPLALLLASGCGHGAGRTTQSANGDQGIARPDAGLDRVGVGSISATVTVEDTTPFTPAPVPLYAVTVYATVHGGGTLLAWTTIATSSLPVTLTVRGLPSLELDFWGLVHTSTPVVHIWGDPGDYEGFRVASCTTSGCYSTDGAILINTTMIVPGQGITRTSLPGSIQPAQ